MSSHNRVSSSIRRLLREGASGSRGGLVADTRSPGKKSDFVWSTHVRFGNFGAIHNRAIEAHIARLLYNERPAVKQRGWREGDECMLASSRASSMRAWSAMVKKRFTMDHPISAACTDLVIAIPRTLYYLRSEPIGMTSWRTEGSAWNQFTESMIDQRDEEFVPRRKGKDTRRASVAG